MNRRNILAMTGFGSIAVLPQIYPARAESGDPIPSRMEYRQITTHYHSFFQFPKMSCEEVLNFFAKDGFELIAAIPRQASDYYGKRVETQYIFAKRVPLEPPA
jgi:hypothetical protein